jgi:ectoine hydroxylase-related dioxygenase (phytanoyl-CoA dioxygenase family)
MLSAAQIARFRQDGFITLDEISTSAEVEQLRGIFDRLFASKAGRERGRQFDLAGTDEDDRPAALPQILNPVEFAPELAQTVFRANALSIAKQLLGPETIPWFEHAILKPANYGAATPWHQDEAHRNDLGCEYEQLSIWMPLQEAMAANGCMQFVAGSHRGPVLEHRSPGNDPRVTALECIGDFDPASARLCPLSAGGATVHHCRTLHFAGPNHSEIPRRAYILAFRGPSRPNPAFQGYSWNAAKKTAAQSRAVKWKNRGGVFGRAARTTEKFLRSCASKARRVLTSTER